MSRKLIYLLLMFGLMACFDNTLNRSKVNPMDGARAKVLRVKQSRTSQKEAIQDFNLFISELSEPRQVLPQSALADQIRLYFPDSTIYENYDLFGQELTYRDSFRILFYEFTGERPSDSHMYLASFHPSGRLIDLLKAKDLSADGNISMNLIDDEVIEIEYADFYLSPEFYASEEYYYEIPDSLKQLDATSEHTVLRNYAQKEDFVQTTTYENYLIDNAGQFVLLNNQSKLIEKRKYPASSTRVLSRQELDRYNNRQLALIQNEILAVHGYIFKTKKERRYFRKKDWYKPLYDQIDVLLNDIEKINLAKIQEMNMTY